MSDNIGAATPASAKARDSVPSYAWMILAVVYIGSIATTFNYYKVGAIMPTIMEALAISKTSGGWLMSVISLVGIFIALPAGIIVKKLGLKTLGIVALTLLVIGNLIGGLTASFELLMVGRFFEGAARALVAVVGPAAMAVWFPQSRRGVATGILATWVGVGQFVALNSAANIAGSSGRYQTVFLVGAIAAAVGLVLYAIFYRNHPPAGTKFAEDGAAASSAAAPTVGTVLKNPNIWFLAIMFMCFTAIIVGTASFYPTFLKGTGIDLVLAGRITSVFSFAPIVLAPLFGILSDRIGSRKKIYSFGLVLGIVASIFMFTLSSGSWPWIWMIVTGITCGAVSSVALACPPEVVGREAAGLGVGVMITGNQIGGFVSPLILGAAADATGSFAMGGYIIAGLLVVGLICGLLVKVR
ncbi:MAG: nitrate/nitrite transporter [Coriobacteriia bacterium]